MEMNFSLEENYVNSTKRVTTKKRLFGFCVKIQESEKIPRKTLCAFFKQAFIFSYAYFKVFPLNPKLLHVTKFKTILVNDLA